jgi:ribosomal-protein-serine acetyltransferase
LREQLNKLLEFHQTFGAHIEAEPRADIPAGVLAVRIKLLEEELDEYRQAAQEGDLIAIADALTDLLYVLLGTYVSHGLQDHAQALFAEVHRSNMSKLGADGRALLRDDGKVLPSTLFTEPELGPILAKSPEREGQLRRRGFTRTVCQDLVIKAVELRDAEEIFALVDASRDYLGEWLPWVEGTKTPRDTREWIQSAMDQQAENVALHCRIVFQGRDVGIVGLYRIDWANRVGELGYWLGQAYQGHGIMTKCCRALIDYAFLDLELNRVEVWAAETNHRSRAVPERLGFVQEGVLRDGERLRDRYADCVVYGMLRRDWGDSQR